MRNPIKYAERTVLVEKNMFYKNVIENNLMMTLYFTCLLECAELLIDISSLAAFLNILFQRWTWQIRSNNWFIFHCIFWIFLFLNLSTISIIIKTLYHTYSLQLVCDKVAFTLWPDVWLIWNLSKTLMCLIEETGDIAPISAGGIGDCQPSLPLQNFGRLRFFGQQEKFWQSQFLQKFPCFVSSFFFF